MNAPDAAGARSATSAPASAASSPAASRGADDDADARRGAAAPGGSPARSAPSATLRSGRWLVKTEPSAYSFADLVREGRTRWEGVENPLALIHLRAMRPGDRVLVYHTGAEKSVVGLARVVEGPYEDPAAPVAAAPKKPRKRAATDAGAGPRRAVVDLEPIARATSPVSIATMRSDPACRDLDLFRISRLSVMPVPSDAYASIASKAGLPSA